MNQSRCDLEYVAGSRQSAQAITTSTLTDMSDGFPLLIDMLFQLPYFIPPVDSDDESKKQIHDYCFESYKQVPYTLSSLYILWVQAAYNESIILYRNVLEVFVQMRFFQRYPDKLWPHLTAENLVNFKPMFKTFMQNDEYYKNYYGMMLSGIAHGGVAAQIFRTDHQNQRVVMGNEFSERFASSIMNQVVPVVLGYFRFFPIFFPNNTLSQDADISGKVNGCKQWTEDHMDRLKTEFPDVNGLYLHLEKLVRVGRRGG